MNNDLNDNLENYKIEDVIYVKSVNYICENVDRPYVKNFPEHLKQKIHKIAYEYNIDLKNCSTNHLLEFNKYIEDNNYKYKFKIREIYIIAAYIDILLSRNVRFKIDY